MFWETVFPERFPFVFVESLRKVAIQAAMEYRPDVILATAPPAGTHAVAAEIASSLAIPWVADYRDILEQGEQRNWRYPSIQWKRAIRRDAGVAGTAQAIVTVSQGLADRLETRLKRKVAVVLNGFDPTDVASDVSCNNIFSITYTGTIYYPNRDPTLLFDAIDRLVRCGVLDSDKLVVRLVGNCASHLVAPMLEHRSWKSCVVFDGYVSRADSQRLQQASQLLLLLCHREKGIMTGKVFEYLAAGRPILAIPGDGDCVDELLRETQAGVSCSSVDEICKILEAWYGEWRNTGSVAFGGRQAAIQAHTRERRAEEMAKILDRAVEDRP